MALKSTIYKVKLNVPDLDRNHYEDFTLSVARHPSETGARMMLRVAAFALNASEHLEFGRGISTDDEPDLWRKDLTGTVELWIELGTPDPARLRNIFGDGTKCHVQSRLPTVTAADATGISPACECRFLAN